MRCEKWSLALAKRKVYLGGLAVYQSVPGDSFVSFLGLVNYKGDCRHSQSPILKTKGALSNPVILTYLQTKLHPPIL